MCVVLIKPVGARLPTEQSLWNCYSNNSDGVGFAIARDGRVHVQKGFLKYVDFLDAWQKQDVKKDESAVVHFRISTSGATNAAMCHPFPLSDKAKLLKAENVRTDVAVAHNGIIGRGEGALSDTALFVRDVLSNGYVRAGLMSRSVDCLNAIQSMTWGNKFAFLHDDGLVQTVGDFEEYDGCLYSNNSYEYDLYAAYYGSGKGELEVSNSLVDSIGSPVPIWERTVFQMQFPDQAFMWDDVDEVFYFLDEKFEMIEDEVYLIGVDTMLKKAAWDEVAKEFVTESAWKYREKYREEKEDETRKQG